MKTISKPTQQCWRESCNMDGQYAVIDESGWYMQDPFADKLRNAQICVE